MPHHKVSLELRG